MIDLAKCALKGITFVKLKSNKIFLIGPMGAGKSSVGKYLAAQLDLHFYDTDEEIENRTGVDIGWIFDLEGEEGFRRRETAVIDELSQLSNIVLATGGGSVIEEENQIMLKNRGIIIYLEVSLKHQETRTLNESRRPLLRVSNRQEMLEKLQAEREPVYAALADLKVRTDKRTVRAVTDEIIHFLKK
jgi:shikimate kinase